MPRDLTKKMQTAAGDDEDFAVPVDEDMEGPMKDFFKEIEELRTGCDKIDAKIKDVKKLQSDILSCPTVDRAMQSQMDDYMAEIKKIANGVRSKLKKIEQEMDAEEKARGQVTGELRIKKTQHMTTSRLVSHSLSSIPSTGCTLHIPKMQDAYCNLEDCGSASESTFCFSIFCRYMYCLRL